jgi:hypothetical protein
MSEQVKSLFAGANSVTPAAWIGVNPDTAKAMYNVAEIETVKKPEELIGKEICIIGRKEQENEKGKYQTFLFIPNQENIVLGLFSLSSKPFIDMVSRSKLPVKGVLSKEPCKKGTYWSLK